MNYEGIIDRLDAAMDAALEFPHPDMGVDEERVFRLSTLRQRVLRHSQFISRRAAWRKRQKQERALLSAISVEE